MFLVYHLMQVLMFCQRCSHFHPQIHELLNELLKPTLDCFLLWSKPMEWIFSLLNSANIRSFLMLSILLVQSISDYIHQFVQFCCCLELFVWFVFLWLALSFILLVTSISWTLFMPVYVWYYFLLIDFDIQYCNKIFICQ